MTIVNSEACAESPVKSNDFQRQWADLGPKILDAIRTFGESGWYILGPEVAAFEHDFAERWQMRFAIGVASGLDAIEIGLRCTGCRPGDRVLLPPVSAFATALAVIKIGAIPVFIDCDRFGLVDLDCAEAMLASDSSIRHFVPVHLYGHCLDMHRLAQLRDRFGIHVIEDCAQSIGASHRGIHCGAAGSCAATSFYPTKNLGALGDGGCLLTNSEEYASLARCLRDYGQSSKYRHDHIGYNSRLDELHAAVMRRVLLPQVPRWNQDRRRIAERYLQSIGNPLLDVTGAPPGSESCWHLFPVLAPPARKQEFLSYLRALGIAAAEHYPSTLMDQPAMSDVPHEEIGGCATARGLCSREVSLPIHPYLTGDEVNRVIQACNSWR